MRSAPQKMGSLESQSGAAVRREQGVTPGTQQRAQDPRFCQGSLPGCPQRFTQHLELPTPARSPPRHRREYAVYPLHPVLHLLWPHLRMLQFLHQVLNEGVLQSVRIRTRLILHTEQKGGPSQRHLSTIPAELGIIYIHCLVAISPRMNIPVRNVTKSEPVSACSSPTRTAGKTQQQHLFVNLRRPFVQALHECPWRPDADPVERQLMSGFESM